MRVTLGRLRQAAYGLALLAGLAAQGAQAEGAAAPDFSGKTITWTVPFPPGGSSGVIAEFIAPWLTRYLPGHPNVTISYESGSASIRGTNQYAARARPDGLNLLITTASTQLSYILGDRRVHYDYHDWHVIMGLPTDGVVFVAPGLGLKGPQDIAKLRGQRLTFANLGATSLDLAPLLAFRLLGLDVQHVFGYRGRSESLRAFERGDVNIDYQTTPAYLQSAAPLVKAGRAVPIFTWGVLDDQGHLQRDPNFPDLPDFAEVYQTLQGHPPSGPLAHAYFAVFAAAFPAQKMVFLPEGTPSPIVAAYEQAFTQMQDNPKFVAQMHRLLGDYRLVTGAAAERLLHEGTTLSPADRDTITSLLTREFGIRVNN